MELLAANFGLIVRPNLKWADFQYSLKVKKQYKLRHFQTKKVMTQSRPDSSVFWPIERCGLVRNGKIRLDNNNPRLDLSDRLLREIQTEDVGRKSMYQKGILAESLRSAKVTNYD